MTDSGGQPSASNLQAGQFLELEITTGNSGCFFYANNPVGVCSFMLSTGGLNPFGSTSQTWIPGIEQTIPKILIAPFALSIYNFHYALICTPTATRDNTSVSIGGAVPVPLTGSWVTNAASYYYLAGSAMRDLQATFYANEIPYQLLKENQFCEGTVDFLAVIEGLHPTHPERLTWWINGTEYLPAKNLEQWSKPFSVGEYEIEMKVRYVNDETTSKTGTLIIKSCNHSATFFANNVLHSELKDATFCNKNVNFRAEIEGLHPTATDRIKWYINGIEETSAINQTLWSKPFENGTYEIKLVVRYDNDTYATLTGTLKIQTLWIKIRNVRY